MADVVKGMRTLGFDSAADTEVKLNSIRRRCSPDYRDHPQMRRPWPSVRGLESRLTPLLSDATLCTWRGIFKLPVAAGGID